MGGLRAQSLFSSLSLFIFRLFLGGGAQDRPPKRQPPAPEKPQHPGGSERPDGPQLPARACAAAQPEGALHRLPAHLHLLR